MYSFELTGATVEVDSFQFVVGYCMPDHVHSSSNMPHVWAQKKHYRLIKPSTLESKDQALKDLIEAAPKRNLPMYVVEKAKALLIAQ